MIKPIPKPKKVSTKQLQKKCDKLLQELGREVYKKCLVCNGEYSCLHHFVKKSQSTALRYDWENCIPLCHACHSSIHVNLNDITASKIALIKGDRWLAWLEHKKQMGAGRYYGIAWYKIIHDSLNTALNEKVHGDAPHKF